MVSDTNKGVSKQEISQVLPCESLCPKMHLFPRDIPSVLLYLHEFLLALHLKASKGCYVHIMNVHLVALNIYWPSN